MLGLGGVVRIKRHSDLLRALGDIPGHLDDGRRLAPANQRRRALRRALDHCRGATVHGLGVVTGHRIYMHGAGGMFPHLGDQLGQAGGHLAFAGEDALVNGNRFVPGLVDGLQQARVQLKLLVLPSAAGLQSTLDNRGSAKQKLVIAENNRLGGDRLSDLFMALGFVLMELCRGFKLFV